MAHHSVWGLEAVKNGAFAPPTLVGPVPFAELRAMIALAETVTAYDILRMRGVPLGKRDYEGQLRTKR